MKTRIPRNLSPVVIFMGLFILFYFLASTHGFNAPNFHASSPLPQASSHKPQAPRPAPRRQPTSQNMSLLSCSAPSINLSRFVKYMSRASSAFVHRRSSECSGGGGHGGRGKERIKRLSVSFARPHLVMLQRYGVLAGHRAI